jgi:hypothetical protein
VLDVAVYYCYKILAFARGVADYGPRVLSVKWMNWVDFSRLRLHSFGFKFEVQRLCVDWVFVVPASALSMHL